MNAKEVIGDRGQVCAIQKAKDICPAPEYKSVSTKVLSEQFKMECDALREEDKFLSFLGGDAWPSEMDTSRLNLLQTNRYDEYVAENRGNDWDVLVSCIHVTATCSSNLHQ